MVTHRNSIVLLFLTSIFILSSCRHTKSGVIKDIKKEFQAINSDTTLQKVTLENEDLPGPATDGGAELTGYFKGEQIRKIRQWTGLSSGNDITEYYFKDGQLIFVYEQFHSFIYDRNKDQPDLTKTETTFEGRYYFSRNKLIDHVTTGHSRNENDALDPEQTLPAEANDNIKLLQSNK